MADPLLLPPLREDLSVSPIGKDHAGNPRFVLYDAVAHKYFEISHRVVQLLSHWGQGSDVRLSAEMMKEGQYKPDGPELRAVIDFLRANLLLRHVPSEPFAGRAEEQAGMRRFIAGLLQMLFLKIPLLRPEPLLVWLEPTLRPLTSRLFLTLTVLVGLSGLILISQRPAMISEHLGALQVTDLGLAILVALTVLKIIHEFGHAVTAFRLGARVPRMGVMLIVGLPLPYTELSDVARIASRRNRMRVDAAGVVAELYTASWALLAFVLAPDGALKAVLFFVASLSWLTSIFINANPLMKFDGYYFLSDGLRFPNLSPRSFDLARWRLREWLLNLRQAPPEAFSPSMHRRLILLGFATWVYRLFLYGGISLIVLSLLPFSLAVPIGLFVMVYFVLRPLLTEIGSYWTVRATAFKRPRIYISLLVFGSAIFAGTIPYSRDIHIPARLSPVVLQVATLPVAGALERLSEPLPGPDRFQVKDPDLFFELALSQARLELVDQQIARAATDLQQQGQRPLLLQRKAQEGALREDLQARDQTGLIAGPENTVFVPFRGLARLDGKTAEQGTVLGVFVTPDAWRVTAYISDPVLRQVGPAGEARFRPANPSLEDVVVTSLRFGGSFVQRVEYPEMTDAQGGPIRLDPATGTPAQSWYFVAGSATPRDGQQTIVSTGSLILPDLNRSFFQRIWQQVRQNVRREISLRA